jgi:hypothetical protein
MAMTHALVRALSRGLPGQNAVASWIARLKLAPELQPLSLVGARYGYVLTAVCIAGMVGVSGLEASRQSAASIGSLLFIPVLVSAWLLGARQALAVSALAIAARFIGFGTAGVDLETAVAEVVALMALGMMTRAAAVGLVAGRERSALAARDQQVLELFAQRERIAANVTNTAIRRLFALTLDLEAVATGTRDSSVVPALDRVIAELDVLTAEFRTLVFSDAQDAAVDSGQLGSSPRVAVRDSAEPFRSTRMVTGDPGVMPARAAASDG